MKTAENVPHPNHRTAPKYGCQLDIGDRLKIGDAYAATNGDWLTVQTGSALVGFVIGPGDPTTYVRPAAPSRAGMSPGKFADSRHFVPDREVNERRHVMGALRAIAHELGVDGPQELESGANARIAGMCIKRIRAMRPAVIHPLDVPGPVTITITGPQGSGKSTLSRLISEALKAHEFEKFTVSDGSPQTGPDRALHGTEFADRRVKIIVEQVRGGSPTRT